VGEAVIASPSRNVVPGEVAFTMDVRSPQDGILKALDAEIAGEVAAIAVRRRVQIDFRCVWRKPATIFHANVVRAVEDAATALGYARRRITSGAGHDACNLNAVMPTAMIFVPCKDGLSHNELEDATQADCAAGANVLLHTTLALTGLTKG
jgi:N-carbamoyl-L-amino-acid hydrolase